jgi:hypothetical protein
LGDKTSELMLSPASRLEALALVQVPEHGSAVLDTRCTERAIGRDADWCVKVASVTIEIVAELAVGEGPSFDEVIPSTRHKKQ